MPLGHSTDKPEPKTKPSLGGIPPRPPKLTARGLAGDGDEEPDSSDETVSWIHFDRRSLDVAQELLRKMPEEHRNRLLSELFRMVLLLIKEQERRSQERLYDKPDKAAVCSHLSLKQISLLTGYLLKLLSEIGDGGVEPQRRVE
jgi:hypothetical protein